MNLPLLIGLAVFGAAALVFGVYMWRNAAKIVTDARQTLHGMFGETHPSLFAEEPDARAARIPAAVMVLLGVGLLMAAVVVLVTAPR